MDTQGLVLLAKVHRANVTDRDGIELLLEPAKIGFLTRLSHLWLDAGYTGEDRGAGWVEKALGWGAEIVVYHDDEAIYLEHKGRDSGVVRFTFEMIEGLKMVEDEEAFTDPRG